MSIRKRMTTGKLHKRSPQGHGQGQGQGQGQAKKAEKQPPPPKGGDKKSSGVTVDTPIISASVPITVPNSTPADSSTATTSPAPDTSSTTSGGASLPAGSGGSTKIETQPPGGSGTTNPGQTAATTPGDTSTPAGTTATGPTIPGSTLPDPNANTSSTVNKGSTIDSQQAQPNTNIPGAASSNSSAGAPVQAIGGGNDSSNSSSSGSQNLALPIGISAGIAAVLLLFFLVFMFKRRKIAAKIAAKERYEAMMANSSLPRSQPKAPILSLTPQQPFKVFQRISALFALQTPSPLPETGADNWDPHSDQAPLKYSDPAVSSPAPVAMGFPLKSCFVIPPETRVSIMDETDRMASPSPVPIDIEAPVTPKVKRESVRWFGTNTKSIRSVDSISILSRDSQDKRLTDASLSELVDKRTSSMTGESAIEKNKSFLSSNSNGSSPRKWTLE